MKKLEIRIDREGSTSIDVSGFVGSECERATSAIEAEIGVVAHRSKKSEYFKAKAGDRNIVRGG